MIRSFNSYIFILTAIVSFGLAPIIDRPAFAAERKSEFRAGHEFNDCDACPRMVVVPAGSFVMGSPTDEHGRLDHEGPEHTVSFQQPFALGKFEVTFDQWEACVADGGCYAHLYDAQWGRGKRPVINIDMDEIGAYLHWLSDRTGLIYRLPSEAEWEYAARAGSRTAYPWGTKADHEKANFGAAKCCAGRALGADRWSEQTAPVGSFPANAFGLHDMHGNVYERIRDCWNPSYQSAPTNGSAWRQGDCRAIGLRGGAWVSSPELLRSAERDAYNGYYKVNVVGFRVARDLRTPERPEMP